MIKNLPKEFSFKTKPFDHQVECLSKSYDQPFFALLNEQGTGKTKIILDNIVYLFNKKKTNALLVIAPNGAQWNWALNEIPKHLALEPHQYKVHVWQNKKTQKYMRELAAFMDYGRKGETSLKESILKIFLLNIEAVSTQAGYEWIMTFLQNHSCLTAIDESTIIKNPKAKRTKRLLMMGPQSMYRRIMTGTPITNGLIDIYCQIQFLSPDIFKRQRNWFAFRARYAKLKQIPQPGGRFINVIDGYKDGAVEEVKRITDPYSSWAVKDECLDLPDKLYNLHYVEMSEAQLNIYNSMASTMMAVHGDEYVTADIAIVKFLRLQQILGGFFPATGHVDNDDDDDSWADREMIRINDEPPKLKKLLEITKSAPGKIIIWAEFRAEIKMIVNALKETYGVMSTVEYHGGVKDADKRKKALRDFQQSDDTARFLVAHTRAAGRSHTLHRAQDVIYYSNSYSLEMRLQSEDRVHRSGLKHNVTYHDIEAVKAFEGLEAEQALHNMNNPKEKWNKDNRNFRTLDYKIIQTLRDKKEIADAFRGMGSFGEWI